MASKIQELEKKKLINPPRWLSSNVMYETMMGSVAYGVSSDTSDMDLYGFCIPTKELIFPHLGGEILGFGRQKERFEQFQQHHIRDDQALGGDGREYDVQIFSIVKYFQLAMENNPNMIDSLYTPQFCVLHMTKIGSMVRDARKLFLHKGSWHKFKGYAYSQLHKMSEPKRKAVREFEEKHGLPSTNYLGDVLQSIHEYRLGKNPMTIFDRMEREYLNKEDKAKGITLLSRYESMVHAGNSVPEGKRKALVEKYGFDIKFAYHVVRLLYEAEMILNEGDIDLQRHREHLKSIRRGEISEQEIRDWASEKEKGLEKIYETSKLRHSPDEQALKELLMNCLEEHYGNLNSVIHIEGRAENALREIQEILDKNRNLI